jgi:hypothetical protein
VYLNLFAIFCSFHFFNSQGFGKCLEDSPTEIDDYTYPELPPGAIYNSNLQCRLQFNSTDENVKVCSKLDEICSQLWCSVNDVCTTLLRYVNIKVFENFTFSFGSNCNSKK